MNFLYCLYSCLVWPFMFIFCPCRITGKENIPDGAAVVCSDHSSNFDAVLLALYFGFDHKLRFMSKAELLDIPVLGYLLKKGGVYGVHRGDKTDIQSIRTSVQILKDGGKIMIFPQGTRVPEGESIEAKTGAVRIAAKQGAPILPVWITPGPKIFRRNRIVVGKPYFVAVPADRDYGPAAEELMHRINELEP